MGPESYGLIGFFTLLQNWLVLLDLGMSPTLSREISRFRAGVLSAGNLRYLFNTLRKGFIFIAVICSLAIFFLSNYLSLHWLKIEKLVHDEVVGCIILMGVIVALRWIIGIYKAAVNGFEKLIWLSSFNAIFSTFRFVIVFIFLYMFGGSPVTFFVYQLVVSAVELLIVAIYVSKLLPHVNSQNKDELKPLKSLVGFSLTIAFTGAVWIVVTQLDKLILSKLLALSEYGYYTLAIQLAGGIQLIGGPISAAILPRMAHLEAEGKHDELIRLYRNATQLIVIVSGVSAMVLVFFSQQVLYSWTGDVVMVEKVSPYLQLYAIGNFLLSVAAFPYYLQYAKGNLRFHLRGNIGFLVFLVPLLFVAVNLFGGIGAGYVWIIVNGLYLFLWVPFIHNFFDKKLNKEWYFKDILKIIIPVSAMAYLLLFLTPESNTRIVGIIMLLVIASLLLLIGVLFSDKARMFAIELIKKRLSWNKRY